ncbi:ubiquitin conjugating enzyme family protein [Pisolithus croceorrhizus]|nr:ubiquitin conjugating enzyme family protein [Pisolithus croceorrhizus]
MDREIQQLVEMGATVPQARAALHKYKDVMQAAERIFDGEFAHIHDQGGSVRMQPDTTSILTPSRTPHASTPDDVVQDHDMIDADDEDDAEDYVDYESDFEPQPMTREVDPYAGKSGIFFSKDRREEVIEVEEEAEFVTLPESQEPIKLMTQGEWMKGCPEGNEQSFLFALYDYLCNGNCPCPQGCGFKVPRKKCDFFPFPSFPSYTEHLRAIIKRSCPTCNIEFCFACGEMVNTANNRPSASSGDTSLFHCSNMQGVILGVGLAMLEATFAEQRQQLICNGNQGPQRSKSNKKRKLHAHSTPTGDDEESDSYYASFSMGRKAKGGTGYAGDQREDTSGQLEAQAQQRVKDGKIGSLLSRIRVYLPSLRRHGGALTSDYMVHPTALAHLRRRFNYLCSTLLRNDSLTDMSDRSVLYFELFEWLETISNHEALASMMAMPIMVVSSVKSVAPKKAIHGKTIIRERAIIYEGSAGPRELLEAIVIQARAAIKGLEGMKSSDLEEEMTEEQKRMTCERQGYWPFAVGSSLLRMLSTAPSERPRVTLSSIVCMHPSPRFLTSSTYDHISVRTGGTEEERKKAYLDWAMQVRFEYCDLTVASPDTDVNASIPHYKFYFNNEARMIANSDFPKRSLAYCEGGTWRYSPTNLPVSWDSSVFLRVDENRVDIIKALIIGPEGTPYQDGCFLFDIFLGPTYNHTPPSVKYMTTNGGKYRFNPNLYADGKVCLSLLGTWSGPGWISGRSTLLQVLVSIQSMILCDEPYLNEPGWANAGGTSQSKASNVRRMVVKTAMLGYLKNPPEPFGDVIRTHYRLKADVVITQLDRWLASDDGRQTTGDSAQPLGKCDATSSSNGFKKDIEEMQSLLRQLQDGTFQY